MSLLSRTSRAVLPTLAALALGTFVAVPAVQAQTTITPGSGYQQFDFGDVGAVTAPFVFTSGTETVFTVVDTYLSGDRFRVLNFGTLVGDTSVPTLGGYEATPEAAAINPVFSKGAFQLGPGSYSLTIETLAAPYGPGRAFYRLDNARVAAVPEPSEWAGMGMASFALCGLMIKARRKAGTRRNTVQSA